MRFDSGRTNLLRSSSQHASSHIKYFLLSTLSNDLLLPKTVWLKTKSILNTNNVSIKHEFYDGSRII